MLAESSWRGWNWWERESIAAIYSCANNRFKESVLLVDLRLSEEEARGLNGGNAGILFVK
jgi:hypothetical protein